MERFLCIASRARGHQFLVQCAEMGLRPTLLTLESLRDHDWPREALEDLATMPAGLTEEQILNTITWMARGREFHRMIAFDEADLQVAARLREHLRVPGMGITTAGYYRDLLAMRVSARDSGFAIPAFCRVLNYDELRVFIERVPGPWLLRPRAPHGAGHDLAVESPEQLWHVLDELGDQQSYYVLEEPLAGERFTVESILSDCRVVFSVVLRHLELPGGIRRIETVDRTSRECAELTALNGNLAPSLGMVRGLTQASFVRSGPGAPYRFDRILAGVGAEGVDQVVEAASGLNLWREWARMEMAHLHGEAYQRSDWSGHAAAALDWPAGLLAADTPELAARELASRVQIADREWALWRSPRFDRVQELAAGASQKALEALRQAGVSC